MMYILVLIHVCMCVAPPMVVGVWSMACYGSYLSIIIIIIIIIIARFYCEQFQISHSNFVLNTLGLLCLLIEVAGIPKYL